MGNKELAKKYFKKYWKEQFINETDLEFKALVRIFNKLKKENPKT